MPGKPELVSGIQRLVNVFANDPLNLLAVDGTANQDKKDKDAASWLPPNKGVLIAN